MKVTDTCPHIIHHTSQATRQLSCDQFHFASYTPTLSHRNSIALLELL